jgi:hypothetical protein
MRSINNQAHGDGLVSPARAKARSNLPSAVICFSSVMAAAIWPLTNLSTENRFGAMMNRVQSMRRQPSPVTQFSSQTVSKRLPSISPALFNIGDFTPGILFD